MSAYIELESAICTPGSVVRGRVALLPLHGDEKRKVELSVIWETEGKGDTDVGVVFYRVLANGDATAGTAEYAFEAQLPLLPLSYRGHLVKIVWRVRVRRLSPLGDDQVIDHDLQVAWPTELG